MDKDNGKQDKKTHSILPRSLFTGFIGGLLWSMLGVVMHYFNVSQVAPKTFFLRSWLKTDWTSGWLGDVVSIGMAGIVSVLTAYIYFGLFKRINSMWMGSVYGIVLWLLVFYIFKPIFTNIPQLTEMDVHTIVSTLCLYVLYGTFIGYSISYDYHDTMLKGRRDKTSHT